MQPIQDNRTWLGCIRDLTIATVKELYSRWQRQYNPLKVDAHTLFPSLQPDNTYNIDETKWHNSRKLVVLIHGLNSSPLTWTNYLPFQDDTSTFIPFLKNKGYCTPKQAARPILAVVQKYAHQYPGNPITLLGHSYGAEIAAYIERKLDAKNIRLISIAGPHCGSRLVNVLNTLGLAACFGFTPKMIEHLTYQGPRVQHKLAKWQNQQTTKNIERVFFASLDDWRIYPTQTSFPSLPNSTYHPITAESHVTIIDAVKQQALSYI